MKTITLASLSTRIPPPLLRRLEDLRHRRSRHLGVRVRMQDLAREAIERLCADENQGA